MTQFVNGFQIPDYEELGTDLGNLVQRKNNAYGDSFSRSGEVLTIMFPNGIPPDKYTDALTIVRVVDKLFRIATQADALGESPWQDVAGYGLLGYRNAIVAQKKLEKPETKIEEVPF